MASTCEHHDDDEHVSGGGEGERAVRGKSDRVRELHVTHMGQKRSLGVLPTRVHTDAATLVLSYARLEKSRRKAADKRKRTRRIELPPARLTELAEAMRTCRGSAYRSPEELRVAVSGWFRDSQRELGDARGVIAYYDEDRARSYHEHNGKGSQVNLVETVLALALPGTQEGRTGLSA